MQQKLAAMIAQYSVGKNLDALKIGEPLLVDARAVGWQPLVGEVALWIGRAAADQGDDGKSIPGFKDAFAAALAGRDEKTLKWAAVRLAQEYIYKNDMKEYDYWQRVAAATMQRGTPDPHAERFLEHERCVALYQLGRVKERLRCLEAHAQKAKDLNEWELTMLGLAAKDAGQVVEAIDWLKRGVDYSANEAGATHPRTLELRGYLCDGYLDLGEYGKALDECQAALRTVREVSPENTYLISRMQLYLGATLREMKRYPEARKLLLEAQKGVKPEGEVLVELAQIDEATGDYDGAIAIFKKSLDEDAKEMPASHPNVVVDRMLLGEALLARGDAEGARQQLAEAYKVLNDDMSPFMIADVKFDYARALWLTRPDERGKALELARTARALYGQTAPSTEHYQSILAKMDKWLGDEATRRLARQL